MKISPVIIKSPPVIIQININFWPKWLSIPSTWFSVQKKKAPRHSSGPLPSHNVTVMQAVGERKAKVRFNQIFLVKVRLTRVDSWVGR